MAGQESIYFDNSATTALSLPVEEEMKRAMAAFGNPSSLHEKGLEAKEIMDTARARVADALGAKNLKPGQLIFTSCGSEATQLALLGSFFAKERRPAGIVLTTDSEHPSVAANVNLLEKLGMETVRLRTRGGVIDKEQLNEVLKKPVALATVMLVNNETGARYDVENIFAKIRAANPEAVLHCDAVQAFLKESFTPQSLGADFITLSAHKIHGPKGVGALYVSADMLKKRRLSPVLLGGGQESGFRSGTENTIGIAGFGKAAQVGKEKMKENAAAERALSAYAEEALRACGASVHLPEGARAPHILRISVPRIKSETMLHYLSAKGICVSAGSACSSRSQKTNPALLAFGMSALEADCSLRISFCESNTKEEIDKLCAALAAGMAGLVHIR
ncbi:MAG: cysteine desulfurase [Clostridia bacterium]|nr:cysteine desulfurase [Clostridia bacterium]